MDKQTLESLKKTSPHITASYYLNGCIESIIQHAVEREAEMIREKIRDIENLKGDYYATQA